MTFSAPVYSQCITTAAGFQISLTSDKALTGIDLDTELKATFTNGDSNTLSVGCDKHKSEENTLVCATGPAFTENAPKGNYTMGAFTKTSSKNTYKQPENTQLCYDITCVGKQTPTTGEIDFNDDTKKTFTITIPKYTGDTAPVVYAGTTEVTCAADKGKTTLTCTPTKEQMANGTHDIFIGACKLYAKTITVKNNSSDPTPTPTPTSGELASISKLLVFILGLLLF